MKSDEDIQSSLTSNQILPSKREIKKMIEGGEWAKLGKIFHFEPKFLMKNATHGVIDWLCVPPSMTAILQQKEPRINWNKAGLVCGRHAFDLMPKKRYRKAHPKTKALSFIEQDGICHYCGNRIYNFKEWTIDHRVPLARGGTNAATNKVGCCYACNHAKGCLTEDEFFACDPEKREQKAKEIHKMLDAYKPGAIVAT